MSPRVVTHGVMRNDDDAHPANHADRTADRARAELRWYFAESAGELGLRAAALEPQSGAASCLPSLGPSDRALRAADRARRVRAVLHRLTTREQAVLAGAFNAPTPGVRHARAAATLAELAGVALAIDGHKVLDAKGVALEGAKRRAEIAFARALDAFSAGWRELLLHRRWVP